MAKINGTNKKRIVVTFAILAFAILLLGFKLAWIQVVKGEEYKGLAIQQQTSDIPVEPKRGTIYDRNGQELATSATCYSLWANPPLIKSNYKDETITEFSQKLAVILEQDAEDVKKQLTKDQSFIRMERFLDRETADKIRELEIAGLDTVENTKRFYPMGDFASQALGSVNDDGHGRSGLELMYDDYLSGVSGRWIKNTDIFGNSLAYGNEKFYKAEDGLNVITTLDEVLQHYAEKAVAEGMKKTKAKRIMCIGMDPKTGDILTMVTNPGFDPNEPMEPVSREEKEKFEKMTAEEQTAYLSEMWKSPLINDVYEPGSTFKLLTASAVLEEGVATPESTYNCDVSYTIPDTGVTLRCWSDVPHGVQTLKEALGNSCNPAMIQMGTALGKDKFYANLEMFGVTSHTNIDYPGESNSIVHTPEFTGPVELATMSFGHGVAVTPIQMVTAVSAIANDGVMMQPRLVKELTDSDGKTVKEMETREVRKVISKKTASEMLDIMEYVVAEGGGGNAKIPGYRIGGKTGTANKAAADGGYTDETYSSFIGVAPVDDPQIVFLVVVDSPQVAQYGSVVAAPIARDFFQNAMGYFGISPQYTEEEKENNKVETVYVPDVTGKTGKEAQAAMEGYGLNCVILPKPEKDEEIKVVDQYPKGGKTINRGGTVYLYRE